MDNVMKDILKRVGERHGLSRRQARNLYKKSMTKVRELLSQPELKPILLHRLGNFKVTTSNLDKALESTTFTKQERLNIKELQNDRQ